MIRKILLISFTRPEEFNLEKLRARQANLGIAFTTRASSPTVHHPGHPNQRLTPQHHPHRVLKGVFQPVEWSSSAPLQPVPRNHPKPQVSLEPVCLSDPCNRPSTTQPRLLKAGLETSQVDVRIND